MEEFIDKEYVLASVENFDEYLIFMGVGYLARKAAKTLKPVQCLVRNKDGSYTFSFKSKFANSEATFVPGEEFIETKADGVKVKALITFDGNKMIHVQIEKSGRKSTHIREFFQDKLIVTTTAEGFDKTVTRVYESMTR